ncbi:MarR family winged helix-turn-helix transcriptional regulator [uncultured Roseobacter sp.]|uniref:MarR family winged helix-turn-helix transcriptional regulator n=1 Tax=uncultured Roseobacter sp. TaxID=114847 RepID=UPI0026119DF1|nr:MarR family winged helix-turn-helix transcriptional regulator [uncultured Roseobacter sp.]
MDASDADAAKLSDYRLDEQVGYLLRLANQRHATIFQRLISEELTPTQFSTLIRVAEQGQVSQNHLGRLAAMDVATTKGVVDRLKAKGLIVAHPDPNDKRRSNISLSASGARMVDVLVRDGQDITQETLKPLTQAERNRLLELLQKLS